MILKKLGIIHSPYEKKGDAPPQGKYSEEIVTIEVFDEFIDAMDGLEEVKSIIVLYWGDRADRERLKSTPPYMTKEYGIFSIRSPHRLNPIAICICNIISIEKNKIMVKGLDAFDGSPLLDIKRFIPRVDTDQDYKK